MSFSFFVARRYRLSSTKFNTVRLISRFASFVVGVAVCAFFIIQSVFSGLHDFGLSYSSSLDPDLKIESPGPSEVAPDKKKMNPHDQRKYAAIKPRHSYKNPPEGRTREKARAYETAPVRGIAKSTWLEKRVEKYDFPLCRCKVRRRVIL